MKRFLESFKVNWGLSVIYFAGSIFVIRFGHLGGAISGILCGVVFLVLAFLAYARTRRR